MKEVRIVYKNRNEWLSTGLLKSIEHIKKLFYQNKIKPTEENIQRYFIQQAFEIVNHNILFAYDIRGFGCGSI